MHRTPGRAQHSPRYSPRGSPQGWGAPQGWGSPQGWGVSPRGWGPPHGGQYGQGVSPRFSPGSGPGGGRGFGAGASGARGRRWEEPYSHRGGAGRPGSGARNPNQGEVSVEKYFSPNMLQDPWKNLSAVSKEQLQAGFRPRPPQD